MWYNRKPFIASIIAMETFKDYISRMYALCMGHLTPNFMFKCNKIILLNVKLLILCFSLTYILIFNAHERTTTLSIKETYQKSFKANG